MNQEEIWAEERKIARERCDTRTEYWNSKFGGAYPETLIRALTEEFNGIKVVPDGLFEYSLQEIMKILQGKRYYVGLGGVGESFQFGRVLSGKAECLFKSKVNLFEINLDELGRMNCLLEEVELECGWPDQIWLEMVELDWSGIWAIWIQATYVLDFHLMPEETRDADPSAGFVEQLRNWVESSGIKK